MNKKYIIIIAVVVVFIMLLSVAIYLLLSNNQQVENGVNDVQVGSGNSPSALPVPQNSQSYSGNTSDDSTKNQGIDGLASNGDNETGSTASKDKNIQPTTLEQLKNSTSIKIPSEIYASLDQNDFTVFSCAEKFPGLSGKGLILHFKEGNSAAYYADLYKKMDKNLEIWESTMFSDLSPLLFSGEKSSQKPVFKSSRYTTENGSAFINVRYANLKSDGGKNISIDYGVFEENIYIFNNPQCLRKTLDLNQPSLQP